MNAEKRQKNQESLRGAGVALTLGYFAVYFGLGLEIVIATPALQQVGFSAGEVGSLWAGRSLLSIAGPVFWGLWADRFGRGRFFLQLAFLGAGLCHIGMYMCAELPWTLSLFFIALGFFMSGIIVMVDGLVLRMLEGQHHRYGRYRLFGGLGFGVAGFSVAQMDLVQSNGFVSIFFIGSAVVYFMGFAAQFKMPRLPATKSSAHVAREALALFLSRPVVLLMVMIVAQWASHGVYTGFLAVSAKSSGIPFVYVGWAVVAAIVTETIFLFASSKALSHAQWIKPILYLILMSTVLRWVCCGFVDSPVLFVLLHGLHGITFGFFHAWVVFQFAKIFPAKLRQTAQGWLIGAGYGLGGAMGMGVGGALIETSTMQNAWFVMAGFALIALVAGTVFSLLEEHPEHGRANVQG